MSARSPRLVGPVVTLREPLDGDRDARKALGVDAEFWRGVGGEPRDPSMTDEEVDAWLASLERDPYFWIVETGGALVGNARLRSVDLESRRAFFTVGIFSAAHRGRGVGTDTTRLVVRFAFERLKLHRVDVRVLAFNQRAIRCYERCGFVREGVERESAWISGRFEDELLMSILETDPLP